MGSRIFSITEIWFLSAGVAVVATAAVSWLAGSRLGLGLRSIRDDEDVAVPLVHPASERVSGCGHLVE